MFSFPFVQGNPATAFSELRSIVITEDLGIVKAASNLPGVNVVKVEDLNAELLAPGTHPGRLVVWTESAFISLDKVWGGGGK